MVRHFDHTEQDIKAAERPSKPQPLLDMHNETVNNRWYYVHITQIFTDTPIFRKVNPRIPLFFRRQFFAPHRQHYSFPENKSFSKIFVIPPILANKHRFPFFP